MSSQIHDCASECAAPPSFPLSLFNPPALERVRYRIGDYASIRQALLHGIDQAVPLQHWTHRLPDDPGIALLESAATVGDILTFYQEHYAQEVWLRTARWRESISELVRLLGYRLSPGLAGQGLFALEVKKAVPVPAGFPLKTDLAEMPAPVDFETSAELLALPALSKFHLYPPRVYASSIAAGSTHFEIARAGGRDDPTYIQSLGVKKGDLLMLVGTPQSREPETVKVASVTTVLDRIIVEIEGGLSREWGGGFTAYRLGRTFRHHGHQAPVETFTPNSTNGTRTQTNFNLFFGQGGLTNELYLDTEIKDLAAGQDMIVQVLPNLIGAPSSSQAGSNIMIYYIDLNHRFTVARTLASAAPGSASHAGISGAATYLQFSSALPASNMTYLARYTDLRQIRVHETTTPALTLRPVASYAAAFPSITVLELQGTNEEAAAVVGRTLLFTKPGMEPLVRSIVRHDGVDGNPRRMALTLDQPISPILEPEDFAEAAPLVTIYGNVVSATQGHSELETPLGNGDATAVFQTFKLPKVPLTYLLDPGATPAEVPELEIYVNQRLWQRVDSLFGHSGEAQIYVVREDAEQQSYLQFGDGFMGSRLPSGLKNVTCKWRHGSGAYGAVKAGTQPKGNAKLDGLDKVHLHGVISGGSAPESEEKARLAAPGRVQSLGRIVSLKDYETELLSIPGILTCTAEWDAPYGTPAVMLRVLMAAGRESEAEAIRTSIQQFQQQRGPDRHPVLVQLCQFHDVQVQLTLAIDPTYQPADVEARIATALGLITAQQDPLLMDGLFALKRRRISQPEYRDQIEGTVQNVPGVHWCRLEGGSIGCSTNQMLRLTSLRFFYATAGASAAPIN
jgi:hypothetical protein